MTKFHMHSSNLSAFDLQPTILIEIRRFFENRTTDTDDPQSWNYSLAALSTMLVGCKIERGGIIDFVNPMFDLHSGPVVFMAFPDSTVVHVGSTYLMLSLPFYVPLLFLVVLFVGLWFILRQRSPCESASARLDSGLPWPLPSWRFFL